MTSPPNSETEGQPPAFIGFEGVTRLARGSLDEAALAAWRAHERGPRGPVLVFDATTGEVIDLDLRGGKEDILARYTPAPGSPPARGRPRLGVTAREVTLLPRHWEWLGAQPGGASAALRRLVDAARREESEVGRKRAAQEAAYRFMLAIGGDLPWFEEAARALFAGDIDALRTRIADWPEDIRNETLRFAGGAPLLG